MHEGLLYKLFKHKVGGKFYDLIKTVYSKKKRSIKHGDQRSELSPLRPSKIQESAWLEKNAGHWIPVQRIFSNIKHAKN
jgi:predicted DNA-binding protein (MmcQ/YjbR family)